MFAIIRAVAIATAHSVLRLGMTVLLNSPRSCRIKIFATRSSPSPPPQGAAAATRGYADGVRGVLRSCLDGVSSGPAGIQNARGEQGRETYRFCAGDRR